MFRKKIFYLTQLSVVGLTGYCLGKYNKSENSLFIDGRRVLSMPGLPIFGTVSAATPYQESGSSSDGSRVSGVTSKL